MAKDVVKAGRMDWVNSNRRETGYRTSDEQMALIGLANQLGSSIVSDEPGIADEGDVRNEAKLLMGLSCISPDCIRESASGRASPESYTSSCYLLPSAARRNTFRFTSPSLSLENPTQSVDPSDDEAESSKATSSCHNPSPSSLLGRKLKVEDRDAVRLSAEAMARNLMLSYQKAIQWRIQAWVGSLSRVLVNKEKDLKQQDASDDEIKELLESAEARLVLKLRELADKIQVLDARTSFKVLPRRLDLAENVPASKKQRTESIDDDRCVLEETEYKYHVAHSLELEGFISIFTPAGYVQIEVQVPGSIKGTFLSCEPGMEELISVRVELNTEILASMIEKSSRIAVRASAEALIEVEPEEQVDAATAEEQEVFTSCCPTPILSTSTPKRKFTADDRSERLVVVTPRETSSPSSYGDSDPEDKPVLLSIPNDFGQLGTGTSGLRMVSPHPSRANDLGLSGFTFARLLSSKTTEIPMPSLVCPQPLSKRSLERTGGSQGRGPCLPVLVRACAAMQED
jgi:hypothetical protein